jgi:tetratricopeptide (TPR) repeat protein
MNDEAIEQMEKAISLDPKNQGFRSINITYLFAGKYENAFNAGSLFEESAFILQIKGQALFRQGKHEKALEYLNRAIKLEPGKLAALTSTGVKAFIEGNLEEGIMAAQKFEEFNIADAEAWYFIAENYGLLGEKEGCLRCLQKAVDGGFFNYPLMSTDFYLDSVRDDPEFQKILEDAHRKHHAFNKRFF